jgi:endosialidase-like protein
MHFKVGAFAGLLLLGFVSGHGSPDITDVEPEACSSLVVSDRDKKQDFVAVDERAVLEGVARMPMSTWSYASDPRHTRHLGPMAQDFKATFALGGTDRAYDPVDAHGVALTSIKALYGMVQEQNARIERLERDNRALRQALSGLPTLGTTRSDVF